MAQSDITKGTGFQSRRGVTIILWDINTRDLPRRGVGALAFFALLGERSVRGQSELNLLLMLTASITN